MARWRADGLRRVAAGLGLLAAVAGAGATEFVVLSLDPAGYGFEDPTPAAPVGGNPGTTLGQQRRNVLQRAGDVWASYLHSPVPIRVEAAFADLGGGVDGFPLAGASALDAEAGFPNAPQADTYYPVALANSRAGYDLQPGANDIEVTINIAPDTDAALPDWYYGFDDATPPGRVNLLDVLLHELGHGLGFLTFVNLSTGARFFGTADAYMRHLRDLETGEDWVAMTNTERRLSALNDPDLVWTGPWTTAAARALLEPAPALVVTAPAAEVADYAYEPALFGPAVPAGGIQGLLVAVDDGAAPATDACTPVLNGAALAGNIAFVDRGSCFFDGKVLRAQQAGATAVVIANNVAGGVVFMSGADVVDGVPLTIPAVSISLEDGQALRAGLPGLAVALGGDSARDRAGTRGGYVRMYAPGLLEGGSSVSHFSPDAAPDLLMEPFINPVLRPDLDLTLTLMRDLGWVVLDIPYPHFTYELWAGERFAPGAARTGPGEDAEGDGVTNLEEYFFGGDPGVPSLAVLPRLRFADPDLAVTYRRTRLATDLAYAYEVSPDLAQWAPAREGVDYTEVVVPLGNDAEEVSVQLVRPPGSAPVYVRVRVREV